jgi:hypothetical protein
MHKETAGIVLQAVGKASEELCEMLRNIQSHCDEDEYKEVRKSVGAVLGSMMDHISMPIYRNHPELVPDELKGIRGL